MKPRSRFAQNKKSGSTKVTKVPYTAYYPHTINSSERNWNNNYYQVVSIDPATKNYAIRIERRYNSGWILPLAFERFSVADVEDNEICHLYDNLTYQLDKYITFYNDCHFIIIEKQLPQNFKASHIARHTISYFSLRLHNTPLLPTIIEVDSKLKGNALGAPPKLNSKQLKNWSVEKALSLLTIRQDYRSIEIINKNKKKDDLADTICQVDALFACWNFGITKTPIGEPPIM